MSSIDILMPRPMLPIVQEQLDAKFTVHRLYEAENPETLLQEVGDRIRGVAMSFAPVNKALLDKIPNAEIVSSFGVGYDHVNVDDCIAANVMVTHTPDVLTEEVADTAFGLLLMTVRELGQAETWLRSGNWENKGPFPLTGATLQGRTMGIFGLGRIGKAIARRAEAFGLDIHYHGRSRQDGVDYPYHASLKDLAHACDTLMIVAPGGVETEHSVNTEVLEALGPNGIVINIGRGSVIDEAALIEALEQGTIYGAGLDVFEHEPRVPEALLKLERVTVLPHVGSASQATRNAMGQRVVDNLTSWFETGKAVSPVPEMG
ncbi:MAG: 2-hydroxyacid dehydrogenase [Roseibium sp.]|uniref:2-hydroxyacid dehydrogenase n=1 Tax=Roseibium sp. TaxID=1936156 RepID=UPI001B2DC1DB|nr:2-hydroxyacid dehydrogenase [Roseibium sp.]MBO6892405.1 2-hydroxyacid dehydrogenase [Roseibium sp.]MBO6928671.1 2-hydroxyacid dehydrogenase [Roseibium sp.]